jgi:SlyX protein
MEFEKRLMELELRSMEQQDLVQKLNEALVSQQRELDDLRRAVGQLGKKLDVMPGEVDATVQEKPPHY